MDLFSDLVWEAGLGMVLKVQSVLILHRFCVCAFTYSLKFFCNLKISTHGASVVIHGLGQKAEKSESPSAHVPQLKWKKATLCRHVAALRL